MNKEKITSVPQAIDVGNDSSTEVSTLATPPVALAEVNQEKPSNSNISTSNNSVSHFGGRKKGLTISAKNKCLRIICDATTYAATQFEILKSASKINKERRVSDGMLSKVIADTEALYNVPTGTIRKKQFYTAFGKRT